MIYNHTYIYNIYNIHIYIYIYRYVFSTKYILCINLELKSLYADGLSQELNNIDH